MRLVRAARDLGLETVAVYAQDDAACAHHKLADAAVALDGTGVGAYLDIDALLAAARQTGCDAVHPGYGFLSERADFAEACARAGLVFVGPAPEHLRLFGDKSQALALARRCQVPVLPATHGGASLEDIQAFFDTQHGAGIVIKAIGGGGGRGMRVVHDRQDLAQAYARCQSEARAAFGVDALYAERLLERARHIEVQIIGDGRTVLALGERDCSVQRRFQKLVEIAPSPALSAPLRQRIIDAALRMAREVGYRSLGTFEFLVDAQAEQDSSFVFMEANPRLQVEHTVTEQVLGLDLVGLQLSLAAGRSLHELGLNETEPPRPRGYAVQLRINAETLNAQSMAGMAAGAITRFDLPAGPGVRIDTHGYTGYEPSPHYDTLLAKIIISSPSADFSDVLQRTRRALTELRIDGLPTNADLLHALVEREDFAAQTAIHTRFFETIAPDLQVRAQEIAAQRPAATNAMQSSTSASTMENAPEPLDADLHAVRAPMMGRVLEVSVHVGDAVRAGQPLAVLDAMKMEHVLTSDRDGRVIERRAQVDQQVQPGQILIVLENADLGEATIQQAQQHDPRAVRPDLQRLLDREHFLYDAARPDAVAKRHARGQRTARENVADLCDDGSFIEYGALAVAAQRSRRSMEDLVRNTPADGMITGIGTINADLPGMQRTRCAVLAYDATVLAGTQGKFNHSKTDRLLDVALRHRLPTVLFAEGGGGRPGDVDVPSIAGLWLDTFAAFGRLSGQVPVVGIAAGRCFAGNAALLGCSDVIIATRQCNIGMAGPAMIEGGGLGVFKPEEIGPAPVQYHNGVVDLLVEDEAAAVAAAKHYLSMFQGRAAHWQAPDALLLRDVVPQNRLRSYDTRAAIDGIVDVGSILELRAGFGTGIHTALARMEGHPVGILANNPRHLGGAIDPDAADKATRFMQLCDAHGLPLISLIDTPGFMVGPKVEEQAQVRHVCRMFVASARLRVPLLSVVLRKSYGLGAMAMLAGSTRSPSFTVAWPTGEFGGMGLEGAVRLGFRKELQAAAAGAERDALYQTLVAQMYERGQAISAAEHLEIDAVIDPAHTRRWLLAALEAAQQGAAAPPAAPRFVDAW